MSARIPTGVEWIDTAMDGGIPKGSWLLLTGEPGVGKSILTTFIISANADKPVVLVTTETSFRDFIRQASQFRIELNNAVSLTDLLKGKSVKSNLIVIDLFSLYRQYREMVKEEEKKPSRALSIEVLEASIVKAYEALGVIEEGKYTAEVLLIIDSMTAFWADKPALARAYSYRLRQDLYRSNITAVLTSQYAPTTEASFGFGLEHVADGIIHMWMDNVEEAKAINRWMIIKKLRNSNHFKRAMRYDINEKGFILLEPSLEEVRKSMIIPQAGSA